MTCEVKPNVIPMTVFTGLPPQHGNVASLAAATYYQQNDQHSPAKYPENGHDTLSDFVTFVCQEAENAQNQVSSCGTQCLNLLAPKLNQTA